MKTKLIQLLILLAVVSFGCSKKESIKNIEETVEKATSARVDFNRDWTFVKSSAEWAIDFNEEDKAMEPVILPHTWNEDDMGPGLKDPYVGGGWYRKHFDAPSLQPGQRLLLEFEGVNNCHKVWVNGGYAGGRNGGFLASLLDITDLLEAGDNTILVRVDNSYDLRAAMPLWIGWNRYGGITRPVWLHLREHSFIACAGVEIRTPQVSTDMAATVVQTHIEETRIGGATLDIRHTLTSPGGKVVSTTTTPMMTRYSLINTVEAELPAVIRPELWSDLSPVLYTLRTEILEGGKVIDSQEDRIGYRFFHFDSEQGFTLNGRPTKLKGANIHIFFPGLGNALPERFHREEMKLMKRMVETFKEVDPDRPVTMVVGGQWEKNDVAGLTAVADIVAYNGGVVNLPKGEFIGPKTGKSYAFKPDYFREIYPNRIHIISEGVLNDYFFARGQWEMEQAGWRVNAQYWSIMNQRPWLCGGSMWCFTDYSYNGDLDTYGTVDRYRLPKDLFHFYEAMWSDHPVLHILGHWNHNAGSLREVVVFTNCKDVELMLNGKSLGKGISCAGEYPGLMNAPLIWKDVAFKEGTIEVRGKFGDQEKVDHRTTAGNPAQVVFSASNDLIADGRDISYLDLTLCDSDGNRCYTINSRLSLTVSGPARLGGPKEIAVSAGLARVAIRSTGDPGDIKVVATGTGLSSGELKLRANALSSLSHSGKEYHVSTTGLTGNPGSKSKPFKTISAAAQIAQPGDIITVHEGVYRERVNPLHGGTSENKRIVYEATSGETVVIKGSEIIKNWEHVQNDTWKVVISNVFFGDFNPYNDIIHGEWYNTPGDGYDRHTGAVYLNEQWLTEAPHLDTVLQSAGDELFWFGVVDDQNTTLWAQFKGTDPNKELVEINVRQSIFYPDSPGRNYITVRGFIMRQAATPWSGAMSEQIGLIGTHWSKGWVIENNVISHSMNTGITLGRYDLKDVAMPPATAQGYVQSIELAIGQGWSRQKIGSHVVRNNHISHCEKNGIHGSLGGIFSTIEGNTICDIAMQGWISGPDVAGLKLLASHDVIIRNNHFYRCGGVGGVWLDWMAQGTRFTRNLLHDNSNDIFMEVDHGPYMIDNNIFLSGRSVRDWSQGSAYVHNLFAGAIVGRKERRKTPYFKPHTLEEMKLSNIQHRDARYHNNMFAGSSGLSVYDEKAVNLQAVGNVYLAGAKPSTHDHDALVDTAFNPNIKLEEKPEGWWLEMAVDPAWMSKQKRAVVVTESLGRAKVPDAPFENPDGTPYRLDTDYFGKKRKTENPSPGPFLFPDEKEISIKVWPKK